VNTIRWLVMLGALLSLSRLEAAEPLLAKIMNEKLPRLGHRNWIVIADSAYPAQSRPGIQTIYIGGDQLERVADVIQYIQNSGHVRGEVLLDTELAAVPEADAPGVTRYREQLASRLGASPPRQLRHEEIIGQLDDAAKTFEVLILKTDGRIPYTTVFVQLDCGYWSADAEQRLRESLEKKQK
jgi:L-fucose mutarotase/ribose pyranase (RbsD/FucU family)